MPHQCLKCGSLFPEGATTILRGCPDCRGTRFFYTQDPLTQAERDRLLSQAERDLPALVEKLMHPEPEDAPLPKPDAPHRPEAPSRLEVPGAFQQEPRGKGQVMADGRLLIRLPKNLQRRVMKATAGWDYEAPQPKSAAAPPIGAEPPLYTRVSTAPAPSPVASEQATPLPSPAVAAPATPPVPLPSVQFAPAEGTAPETVRIADLGKYEIDVQRLLEKSPIVIQKDGSYVIHLASLFEMPAKKPP